MTDQEVLLEITGLKKHFPIRGGLLKKDLGAVKAIDGVSFFIRRGETVGLVGESGCGKTTTGRCTLMLTPPTAGNIYYKMPTEARDRMLALESQENELNAGTPLNSKKKKIIPELEQIREKYALNRKKPEELRRLRSNMQIVFQDPYSSLNPRMLIKDIVGEPLMVHGVASGTGVSERVRVLMEKVGLSPEHIYRYPHEFSGGQRQRIGVARALSLNPDFIVLDEPTSALDVSVQAQILNLLNDLQKELNLTYMFISHDLSTIKYMCDRINIMYLGKIVESGSRDDIFTNGLHPYTEALLHSIPIPDPRFKRERVPLSGD
ncbi:MAG TPA: ATP-binding cassette domain-containing protein, partial [Methanomassiliicoccales archaeon]|nr:ATP-binding cassette domain-containing protein [Methanomassiliicoccales archaeon]